MRRFNILAALVGILISAAGAVQAQTVQEFSAPAVANWYNTANWTNAVVPSNEFGDIGSVSFARSAFVDAAMADNTFNGFSANPGEVRIGALANPGPASLLEIRSGGTFHVQPDPGVVTDGGVEAGSAGASGTLRVLPGGAMTVDNQLFIAGTVGPNPASRVEVGGAGAGTATLTVGSANVNGVLQTFANSDFNVIGGLSFTGGGNYRPQVTAGSNAKVDVTGDANLGGTMTVDITGFSPAFGQTWTVLEAAAINGNFAGINSPNLGLGHVLTTTQVPAAGGREQLQLTFGSALVLNVNRDSGAVSIGNPNAPNIGFDGYSIRSTSGKLSATGWTSLDDTNSLGGDWRESNVSANQLAELKPTLVGTINGNNNQTMGAAYNPLAAAFGTPEDVTFDYTLSNGSVVQGTVVYSGTRVNNLLLQVDPSGLAKLKNTSQTTVMIDGYDVASASGSLSTAGWTSFDDLNAQGGDWRESNADQFRLAELKSAGASSLLPGASLDLGDLFTGATSDLVFSFLQAGASLPTVGAVIYQAFNTAVPGDYSGNGVVDAADYTIWRDRLGQSFTLTNEVAAPLGQVTSADYDAWKARFGNTSGSGAGGGALAAGVPEPSTLLLVCLGLVGLLGSRRK